MSSVSNDGSVDNLGKMGNYNSYAGLSGFSGSGELSYRRGQMPGPMEGCPKSLLHHLC
jgi:hypothetical protein